MKHSALTQAEGKNQIGPLVLILTLLVGALGAPAACEHFFAEHPECCAEPVTTK